MLIFIQVYDVIGGLCVAWILQWNWENWFCTICRCVLWHCGHSLFDAGNASTIYVSTAVVAFTIILLLLLLLLFIRVVISPFIEVEKHTVYSKTAIYVESFTHLFIHSLDDDSQLSLTLIVAETNPPIYDECSFSHHIFICQIQNAISPT